MKSARGICGYSEKKQSANESMEPRPAASSSTFRRCEAKNYEQNISAVPQVFLKEFKETFDLQARDLISQCLMSERRRSAVQLVISDLTNRWRTLLRDFQPIVYGSIANGLAMETSDIDCFVYSEDLPEGMERIRFLLDRWRVMLNGGKFCKIIRVPSARVPILKALHNQTGFEIDISCTSDGALHNSPLINYIVHQDLRVRDLIILVSYFLRRHSLVGTNRFVSYSVTWLVIFYLQNVENPIIPPLCQLICFREDAKWPQGTPGGGAIFNDLAKRNTSTLAALFCGYFKFYLSFDFSALVVSPYVGCGIPVGSFVNPDLLPEEFISLRTALKSGKVKNNFTDRIVCVQDPIEHHLNTTHGIRSTIFKKFVNLNTAFTKSMVDTTFEGHWLKTLMSIKPEEVEEIEQSTSFEIEYLPFKTPNKLEETIACLQRDLNSTFNLLLMTHCEHACEPRTKIADTGGSFNSRPLLTFEVKTFYQVFTGRFRGLYKYAIKNPSTVNQVMSNHVLIAERMKRPTAPVFHSLVGFMDPREDGRVKVVLTNKNENDRNKFKFMSEMLREHLGGILNSVRVANGALVSSTEPKPSTSDNVSAPVNIAKPYEIFIKVDKGPNSTDPWHEFKRHLTAVFDLLLLSYEEMDPAPEDPSIANYEVHSNFNVFTKRFNFEYQRVISREKSCHSVREQFLAIAQQMKQQKTSFRCQCVLEEAPNGVTLLLFDVNENVHNNFSHIGSNLISLLPELIRAVADVKSSA